MTACERCCEPLEHGEHGLFKCPLRPRRLGIAMIDDQLPGGPRWIENMSAQPVYVENKTQWHAEMKRHGVRHVSDAEHKATFGSDAGRKRQWFS